MESSELGVKTQNGIFNRIGGLYGFIGKLLASSVACLLAVMAVAICYQVFSRYLFNAPSVVTEEVLRFSLIWMGFLSAGLCFMRAQHLNLPLVIDMLPERKSRWMEVLNAFLVLIFGIVMIWGGWQSYTGNAFMKTPILQIPMGTLQVVVLISGVLILFSQVALLSRMLASGRTSVASMLSVVAVIVLIALAARGLFNTQWVQTLVAERIDLISLIVLFVTFAVFLIIGAPIAIGLAFAGVFTLALQLPPDLVFSTVSETIFNGIDSFGFLALPFFILAGSIMNRTGLAMRLIDLAMLMGGRIPGSLWQSNILANMLFGTLSGSGIAAATAIGGIVNPVAREKGYDMAVTTAINAASAPTGMLIPPSGALIVYSLITGGSASIIALFVAGYVPGLIMGGSVMIMAYYYAKKLGYESDSTRHSNAERLKILLRAMPSLLLVFIVIGGILGGAFTAIEGSGIAVFYSFVLALLYRALSFKALYEVLVESAAVSGVILFLIACSSMMSWSMTFASIPATVGELLSTISDNKIVILLLINVVLLMVGVFMDMSPAMLIFTPILFPVVTSMGVDPVHFGIILVYNLCMGLVTPPVGTILFVACSISGEKITKVLPPLVPIFGLQIVGLLLVTFVPAISLALPRLFGLI
ncbi:TRAP transporter large permease subunit [Granulosicoccus antarcticus]|uniref:C4-dicarboxylate TRAP transporter large permease protein DctM n=1 Tax=Granulosicoccus antarcticus IMCC3135 TaxID=1192854 RepID=A0A2Z2P2D6_9GAMM|nr:TRAP transporter large permease subunit [Granulosicoccus antarcticus]ASJ73834.1 C4-dicarboxylate TRAP transporter large permease protein DctM [Granulosicoccus antarcticus IMCC3135]